MDGGGDPVLGGLESRFEIAVAEGPRADDVGADGGVKRFAVAGQRLIDRHDDRQRAVADFDQVERVFGQIAVVGQHDGHGLAGIADAVHREAPVFHRRADADQERGCEALRILARHDGGNARHPASRLDIDAQDFRMRVGRAENGGVQGARLDRKIVGVPRLSRQDRGVFQPWDRLPDQCRRSRCVGSGRKLAWSLCQSRHCFPPVAGEATAGGSMGCYRTVSGITLRSHFASFRSREPVLQGAALNGSANGPGLGADPPRRSG